MAECRSEKEQFWRWMLEEQTSSGQSIRAFCKQEGLSEPSFYSWCRTIFERDSKESQISAELQSTSGRRESITSNDRQQSSPSFIPDQVVQELPDDSLHATEESELNSVVELVSSTGWIVRVRTPAPDRLQFGERSSLGLRTWILSKCDRRIQIELVPSIPSW